VADPGNRSLPRIILGIDPGTMATGWGVVQVIGNALRHMGHGTINSQAPSPKRAACAGSTANCQKSYGNFTPTV
jgi:hypothetical protein